MALQAGEDWRRADTKSFCVTLGQSRRGRFYAPATVTITKGALSGPSHHLLVMRLRPFDPLPSVWALGDGSFTLTITAVSDPPTFHPPPPSSPPPLYSLAPARLCCHCL